MTELTMKVLGEMVKLTESSRHIPITRIYLNPQDWQEVKDSMEMLVAPAGIKVASSTAFGILVQVSGALEPGTFVLEYMVLNNSHLVAYKVLDHES